MIITRTPFRISFFGGGTDHRAWYRKYGGKVLSTTIDKYCYVSCRTLPPFFEHSHRIVWSKIELVKSIDKIQNPIVRECLKFMKIHSGIEIHYDGDLPARTGLGTSSSFTVGLLHALSCYQGKMIEKKQLAKDAIFVEQNRIKDIVGVQDQTAAAYGGLNQMTFHKNGEISVRPIVLSQKRLRLFQQHFMLYFTGFIRNAADIERDKLQHFVQKKQELLQSVSLVDQSIDILYGKEPLVDFGTLLHKQWMIKRSLSPRVSSTYIDAMYQKAMDAGCKGGKLLGAGGGGFLLLFVRPGDQPGVRKALSQLLEIPFSFELAGSQIVFYEPDYQYVQKKRSR